MVIELFLIGVGLSMDAFAVSVCKGLGMEKINKKHAFLIGLYFGGFQALMPFLGWALGIRFQKYITSVDHWIAFFLLLFIGGKMVIEAVRDKDVQEIGAKDLPLDHKEMLLLAVATSIDALAVGITFAFLNVSIMEACLIIGCTTFVLSIIGVVVGNFFGTRYKKKAEIAFEKAEDMKDRVLEVMIEGKVADENAFVGRTYKDAPNVDGLIFVNADVPLMSGDFCRVRVTGALEYDLIGELADEFTE